MDQGDVQRPTSVKAADGVGERPAPRVPSLVGAIGAGFMLLSLFLFLGEIDGDNRRIGGLVACLLFQAMGIGLMLLTRRRASTTAGVGLTALAVVPLMVFLFVDVKNPGKTIDSPSSFTSTATMMLLAAAALWLLAYFVGPGRRYGLYLAGALVAIWLVAVVQIVDNPVGQIYNNFTGPSYAFESVGSSIESGSGDDFYYEDEYFEDPYQDDFGSTFQEDDFDSFESDFEDEMYGEEYPYQQVDDPSTKLGWASLLFGLTYLALGAYRDRAGDGRAATPLIGVSTPILLVGLAFLSSDFGDTGTAILAMVIGAAQIFVGCRAARRFTSWFGAIQVGSGVIALVEQAVGDSTTTMAIVLLILGVAVTIGALFLEGGLDMSNRPDGTNGPGGSGQDPDQPAWSAASPAAFAATPPTAPSAPPPWEPDATAPATLPDSPPAMQAPAAPAWAPDASTQQAPADPAVWAPPPTGPADESGQA